MGAVALMAIPPLNALGVRQTVNTGLTPAQTTWNLRSALNVAALNCLEPEYAAMTANYGAFLKTHARHLTSTNRALEKEYRDRYGAAFRDPQDSYMTQVYNYYALPPVKPSFCRVAYSISQEALTVPPAELDAFAATALPRIEAAFEEFFAAYDSYRTNLAAWEAEYGPPPVNTLIVIDPAAPQPGESLPASPAPSGPIILSQQAQPPAMIETAPSTSTTQPVLVLPSETTQPVPGQPQP